MTSIRDQLRAEAEAERAALANAPKPELVIPPVETLSPAQKVAYVALLESARRGPNLVAAQTDDRTMTADDIQQAISLFGGESIRLAISGDDPSLSEEDIIGIFTDLGDRVVVVELGDEAPTTFTRFMQAVDAGHLASTTIEVPENLTVVFVCDSPENHLYRCKPLANKATHLEA